ncbi:MAG: hypothetical protein WCO77_05750 [bacterium]
MKSLGIKIIGVLMLFALLGGMFPCDSDCGQDDHSTQECGCQAHCAIAIITPSAPLAFREDAERLFVITPSLPVFSMHSAIFRPPIA